jgi:hypothetical protein
VANHLSKDAHVVYFGAGFQLGVTDLFWGAGGIPWFEDQEGSSNLFLLPPSFGIALPSVQTFLQDSHMPSCLQVPKAPWAAVTSLGCHRLMTGVDYPDGKPLGCLGSCFASAMLRRGTGESLTPPQNLSLALPAPLLCTQSVPTCSLSPALAAPLPSKTQSWFPFADSILYSFSSSSCLGSSFCPKCSSKCPEGPLSTPGPY